MAKIELLLKQKERAYRRLYEFTRAQCTDCSLTDCACKDSICAHVQKMAHQKGHEFQTTGHRLRFIGCQGCVVPPHLRETCTIYLCEPAQKRPDFPKDRYERLKNICAGIELKLMNLE